MNIYICLYLLIIFPIGLIYWLKTRNLPLHPDTAEFLYPGLVVSLKQRFEPCKILLFRKWWVGTIVSIAVALWWGKKKMRLSLEFPPLPYCELDSDSPPVRGGNPTVQQKMAIYYLFKSLGRIFTNIKTDFRILQTIIILCIALVMYSALSYYTSHVVGLCGSIFVLVLLTLPFFDTHQIHAELYGVIVLLFAFWLISSNEACGIETEWNGILAGLLLVSLVIFVKITFASDAFVFLLYPLFITNQATIKVSILKGELAGLLSVLLVFSCTRYFMKLINILDPFTLLEYRRKMLSMHKSDTGNHSTSENRFNKPCPDGTNWFYLHFNLFFNIGFVCAAVFGIIIGMFLHKTFFSLYGFLLFWALISLVVLKAQNKFYATHFIPPLIPIILLWGIAINGVYDLLISSKATINIEHAVSYGLLFVLTIPFLIAMWAFYKYVVTLKPSTYFLTSYLKRENPHLLQLLAAPSIGEFIRKNSSPSDRLFTFGYANTVYLYAHRRASLEFLEGCLGIDPEISNSIFADRWKWWVCRDIHKFRPKYIVDMDGRMNMDSISDSTGLVYKLDKVFYKCFNIYILEYDSPCARFGGSENIDDLVLPTSQTYEQRIEFNRKLFKNYHKGFESMPSGLSDLMLTWQKSVDGKLKS